MPKLTLQVGRQRYLRSKRYAHVLGDCRSLRDLQGGCLGNIGVERGGKFCKIVREKRCVATGAGDGDVGEAGVEQVRVNAGVRVNEDAFCGEALGAVAGLRSRGRSDDGRSG